MGSEMTFMIPQRCAEGNSFDKLLQELDSNLKQLKISSYGISDTSLEEVSRLHSSTLFDKETFLLDFLTILKQILMNF